MKFLNIGIPELFFLLILMLIFLGPKGMEENARKLALLIRKITRSKTWRSFMGIYKEVKEYPAEIMKEVDLDELQKDLNKEIKDIQKETESNLEEAGKEINSALQEQDKEIKNVNAELIKTNRELHSIDLNAPDEAGTDTTSKTMDDGLKSQSANDSDKPSDTENKKDLTNE